MRSIAAALFACLCLCPVTASAKQVPISPLTAILNLCWSREGFTEGCRRYTCPVQAPCTAEVPYYDGVRWRPMLLRVEVDPERRVAIGSIPQAPEERRSNSWRTDVRRRWIDVRGGTAFEILSGRTDIGRCWGHGFGCDRPRLAPQQKGEYALVVMMCWWTEEVADEDLVLKL